MNIRRSHTLLAMVLAAAIAAPAARAQVNPKKLPKVSCSQLTFSQDFLEKYPKAPAACQEARVYQGKRFAKFVGKVSAVTPTSLTVQISNVAGDTLSAVSFKPSPKTKLLIDGKPESFSQVKVGDPLTFWVPENKFSIYSSPGAAHSAGQGLPPQ